MDSLTKELKTEKFLTRHFHRGCGIYRVYSDSFKLNKSELTGVKWLYYGVERNLDTDPWEASYLALIPKEMSDDEFDHALCGLGHSISAVNLRTTWEHKQLEM